MLFTWDELKEITRGQWRGSRLPLATAGVKSVTDDSRTVQPGDLFIAISGQKMDGHHFLAAARQAGAIAACVNRRRPECKQEDLPLLCVDSTLNAFHELARAHRRRFSELDVVGVTGSNGKTSVRCMISSVLEHAWPGRVLSTLGNTNNHFGVPRNLLRLKQQDRVAVLEIGSNQPGEIAQLTRLIRPRIGVITNIGPAHLEFFGDTLGVVMEKGSLLTGLQGESVAVIPEKTQYIEILRQIIGNRPVLTFGDSTEADVQAVYHGCNQHKSRVTLVWPKLAVSRELAWSIGGSHQALNAAATAAVATVLGLDPDTIIEGLRKTVFPGMRMQVEIINRVHWVNDAYNANPASMRFGIEWFSEITRGVAPAGLFLVLGDMLELGDDERAEHVGLLQWVRAKLPEANLLPVGPLMKKAAEECGLQGFARVKAASLELRQRLQPGNWVFLKGSRSLSLETVIE